MKKLFLVPVLCLLPFLANAQSTEGCYKENFFSAEKAMLENEFDKAIDLYNTAKKCADKPRDLSEIDKKIKIAKYRAKEAKKDGSTIRKIDSTRYSSNPTAIVQTLATPSTAERIKIAEKSAQEENAAIAAQVADSIMKMRKAKMSPELLNAENEIKALFDELLSKDSHDAERIEINNKIAEKMKAALRMEGSFFYGFDQLKNIGRIYSDDYNVRAYTWCCEMEDMTYRFYGFIQDLENDRVWALEQQGNVYIPRETEIIYPRRWYGALYYKIINIKKGDDPVYIMLGWSQPSANLKMKVMEVLTFDDEKIELGGTVFKGYRGKANRIVFPYCANLNMSLDYNEKNKSFIFDHLTPLSDEYNNPLGCMGPDMSYDMLKKKGKRWILKTDIDVKNAE